MRHALDDLRLEHLTVLYPGERRYDLEQRVTVVPLSELATAGAAAVIPSPRTLRRRRRTVGDAAKRAP